MTFAQAIQNYVLLALAFAALAFELFAFVDSLIRPTQAYVAAGKRTKVFWSAILGVSAALGVLALPLGSSPLSTLGFLAVAAVVAAGIYMADVRPALRQIRGGGGRSGPYGPW